MRKEVLARACRRRRLTGARTFGLLSRLRSRVVAVGHDGLPFVLTRRELRSETPRLEARRFLLVPSVTNYGKNDDFGVDSAAHVFKVGCAMFEARAIGEVTANFAGPHLWAAARFARVAYDVEQQGVQSAEPPTFHDELQAHVVAAVLLATCAAEAWAGEVAMRPAEHFAQPFTPGLEQDLANLITWSSIPRKYGTLATLAAQPAPDFKIDPDKALDDLRVLRNALVHFHPESLAQLKTHADVSAMLATRCRRSPLLDPSAPHFPMAFASYDCARWAVQTAQDFIERFAAKCGWGHPWTKPIHAAKLVLPP